MKDKTLLMYFLFPHPKGQKFSLQFSLIQYNSVNAHSLMERMQGHAIQSTMQLAGMVWAQLYNEQLLLFTSSSYFNSSWSSLLIQRAALVTLFAGHRRPGCNRWWRVFDDVSTWRDINPKQE